MQTAAVRRRRRFGAALAAGALAAVAVGALGSALREARAQDGAGGTTVSVRINGSTELTTLDRDGEVYIPVSALKKAGAEVTRVGDTLSIRFAPAVAQAETREGRVGEWVTNGVWRARVAQVRAFGGGDASRSGVDLSLELMNASKEARKVAPGLTSARVKCVDSQGTALAMGGLALSGLDASLGQEVPPERQGTLVLRFFYPAGKPVPQDAKPGKLILEFDPAADKFPSGDPTLTILLSDAP